MPLVSIDKIRRSVSDHAPQRFEIRPETRQAAVAVVLKSAGHDTEALFILRAEKDGDPWSGQMAFPGGHQEAGDPSLRHTAERETREEIGLDLARHGDYIGQIDPVRANPGGRNLDLIVTPFVYELKGRRFAFAPNFEVEEVLWGSLDAMHSGVTHTMGEFAIAGETAHYPGYGVGGEIVWGLTYRLLDNFFALLDPAWVER